MKVVLQEIKINKRNQRGDILTLIHFPGVEIYCVKCFTKTTTEGPE